RSDDDDSLIIGAGRSGGPGTAAPTRVFFAFFGAANRAPRTTPQKEFLGCRTGAATESRPYRGFHCFGAANTGAKNDSSETGGCCDILCRRRQSNERQGQMGSAWCGQDRGGKGDSCDASRHKLRGNRDCLAGSQQSKTGCRPAFYSKDIWIL